MKASGNRRERGAYFTPSWLARSLAKWAVRDRHDIVIDPAAGDGELLVAAADRLLHLGGVPQGHVVGVELHARTSQRLKTRLSRYEASREMIHGDFFRLWDCLPKCDAVIANPPYVRHHEIPRPQVVRMRDALDGRAGYVGGRASAWAYFLVHAASLLKSGGRLAFVLPAEVLTSDYARALVDSLAIHFQALDLVYCDGIVFPGLSQKAVLFLAEGYDTGGNVKHETRWRSLQLTVTGGQQVEPVDIDCLGSDAVAPRGSLLRLLAPAEVLAVEQTLAGMEGLLRLGDAASIGIGYVTGASRFFHLSEERRKAVGLPVRHLTRALARSSAAPGVLFNGDDWASTRKDGKACWLFTPRDCREIEVQRYLRRGRKKRVNKTYKCEGRSPWWSVALSEPAPAFMSYMGANPRILANRAAVQVSNSMFELRSLRDVSADLLAAASLTSVFQLSALLNARLLGGGLRKLEPSDAARVLVPRTGDRTLAPRVDRLVRAGKTEQARRDADTCLLIGSLGMSEYEVGRVRAAIDSLIGRL